VVVTGINDAHARLTWGATAGAAEYRVYRTANPGGSFDLHATEQATLHEDQDVFADGQTWYYLIHTADACGNEGP